MLFRLRKSVRRSEAWNVDIFYSSFGVLPGEIDMCVACCRGYCVDYMVGKEGKVVHYVFDTFMIICKRTVCFNILYICYKNRLVFFTKKERLAIYAL